jgi:uncharacterized membrane protein YhaH (DUF805 family)
MENPYSAPQSEIYTATSAPAAPLTWQQILFSLEGRIPRRTYWGVSILVGLIQLAVAFALSRVFSADFQFVATIIGWVLMIWPTIPISTKRWHDRNKSGWWILVILIPSVLGIFTSDENPLNPVGIASMVAAIFVFIQCGCLRGTVGPNKYGEDPT